MPEVRRYLDHPCFFVHDAAVDLTPEDVPSTDWATPPYIRRTERMIAVGTIADVDGEVRIRLDTDPTLQGIAIFEGSIITPSGALAITQSSTEEILRLDRLPPMTALRIGVDDMRNPARVHISIR